MKSFENPAPQQIHEQNLSEVGRSVETEISLRVKEQQGTLTPEEFNTLIDADFEEILRDIPPLTDEFDPDSEIHTILSYVSEDRKDALFEFKDKLIRQRKAIAECRCFMERMIAFDNDVPRERLLDMLARFATQYGFSEKQFTKFEYMFDRYYSIRSKMFEKRAAFPDDRELVKDLTGIELDFHAECRVDTGPISFDIYTDGMSAAAIYHKHTDATPNFRHGGFSTHSNGSKPVLYNVINMDPIVRKSLSDTTGEKTLIHEQEHQKNRVLAKLFSATIKSYFEEHVKEYKSVRDPEFKREILEVAFGDEMTNAYERARDEIIAILSSKSTEYLRKQTHALFFSYQIEAYDYLKTQRENADLKYDGLYQEVAKELLVDRYKTALTQGIMAITSLVDIGGYTNAEATALLTDKSLTDWPKTARRILAQDETNTTSQNAL